MLGQRKRTRERLAREYGCERNEFDRERDKNKINLIKLYHEEMVERDKAGEIDDITWQDLQMDDIFTSINYSKSFVGSQYLYHKLHCVDFKQNEMEQMERNIQTFSSKENLRLDMEEQLAAIGKEDSSYYYLASFLMNAKLWKISNMFLIHFMQILLAVVIILGIVTRHEMIVGILVPICLVNLVIHVYTKNRYESFMFSIGTLKQILELGRFVIKDEIRNEIHPSEDIVQAIKELLPISKRIMGWQSRINAKMYGDLTAILADYIYGVTLLDVSNFNYIMKVVDGKQDLIMKLFDYIGALDLSISIASYRQSLPEYCIPQVGAEEMSMEGLVHPLLNNPVENDFRLENRAIVTGANAAGKSTFLKALAINAIFAKSIYTCTARRFQIPDVTVMTSMALRDDVISGESYYIREAKRIKQMLELENTGKRGLFIIDEMLKGTNTSERVSASIAILAYLAKTKQMVIVATHDTEIGNKLEASYDSFYFDSTVTDEKIIFDYKIHKGKGGRTNAIALLSLLNYPEEIVVRSRRELSNVL